VFFAGKCWRIFNLEKVRQADGTTGTVRIVKTEQKTQTMYNLDIANLDNFYVGEQGWLVHNAGPCPRFDPGSFYSYKDLKSLISNMSPDAGKYLEAHHLLPKSFASTFGLDEDEIISVMLTVGNHRNVNMQGFGTNIDALLNSELRSLGIVRSSANPTEVWTALRNVYTREGYSDWAQAVYTVYIQPRGIPYY
jgi:hypothetical protein